MRTHNEGLARAGQLDHGVAHDVGPHRIQAARGLVEDQDLGIVEQGLDELDLLLHALREFVRLLLVPPAEAELLEPGHHPPLRLGGLDPLEFSHEDEEFFHDHPLVEASLFRHVADAVAERLVGLVTQDQHFPGVRTDDVHGHTDRRGLAGPVRPEQAKHRAHRHFEVEALDRDVALKGLANILQL